MYTRWEANTLITPPFLLNLKYTSNILKTNFIYLLIIPTMSLPILEADSKPFSILAAEPRDEPEDAFKIVQAMQEVQAQVHAPASKPVDTSW